jgi:hypothetical protein
MNLKRVTDLVATIVDLEASIIAARADLIREVNGDPGPAEPVTSLAPVPSPKGTRKMGRPVGSTDNKTTAIRSMAARGNVDADAVVGAIGGSKERASQMLYRLRRSGELKRVAVGVYTAA